jgi:hypothetical protein
MRVTFSQPKVANSVCLAHVAIGVVALIAWRALALSGDFPIKFGNVEYEAKEAAAEAEEISESQERRIRALEVLVGARDPASLEDDR